MQISGTIDNIIKAIKTELSMSHVYNHTPLMNTGVLLKDGTVENGVIHVCVVTRQTAAIDMEESENINEWRHNIVVELRRNYIDSASQTTHDNELDQLLDMLSSGGVNCSGCGSCGSLGSIRLAANGPFMWFQNLVHYGRIELGLDLLS